MNSGYGIIFGAVPGYPHYIQTTVPSAFEAIAGERITAAGITVGEITRANITARGQAHIVMGLDKSVWPIPSDSVLALRMGGTIKYTDRYISIAKGRARSTFGEHATVPAKQFMVPVEYNELFNVFDKPTRAAMQTTFTNAGPTFSQAAPSFRKALDVAAPVVNQAAAVFHDVGYDQQALSTLVTSTAQLSNAVARSNPSLQALIEGAAHTFGTIASQSATLGEILDNGTQSLRISATAFAHVASDLPTLTKLLSRVKPGVTELDRLAQPLDGTLQELVNVEPTAVHTLRTVARGGPKIRELLVRARTQLMPQLGAVASQAADELTCIRPFTPDIVGIIGGWAGWQADGLNNPHVKLLHGMVSLMPFPNTMTINTAQLHQILPGLSIGLPQLPGEALNQPWPQPQCGMTLNDLSSAHDPENNTYDPNGSKLVPYPSTTSRNATPKP